MVVRKSHWKRVKGHLHLFIWQRKPLVTFTLWVLPWSTWICPNAPSEVCLPTCFTTSQTWWLQVTFQCGSWMDRSPDPQTWATTTCARCRCRWRTTPRWRWCSWRVTSSPATPPCSTRCPGKHRLHVCSYLLQADMSVLPRLVHHDLLDLLLQAEDGDADGGVETQHQQDTVDNVS